MSRSMNTVCAACLSGRGECASPVACRVTALRHYADEQQQCADYQARARPQDMTAAGLEAMYRGQAARSRAQADALESAAAGATL